MAADTGASLEDKVAKLGKEIVWLRLAIILALVVLALVAVAVIQLRTPVSELADAQTRPATVTVKAARFVVLDSKGQVRGEFGVEEGAACIEIRDAKGEVVWRMPAAPPPSPDPDTKAKEQPEQ